MIRWVLRMKASLGLFQNNFHHEWHWHTLLRFHFPSSLFSSSARIYFSTSDYQRRKLREKSLWTEVLLKNLFFTFNEKENIETKCPYSAWTIFLDTRNTQVSKLWSCLGEGLQPSGVLFHKRKRCWEIVLSPQHASSTLHSWEKKIFFLDDAVSAMRMMGTDEEWRMTTVPDDVYKSVKKRPRPTHSFQPFFRKKIILYEAAHHHKTCWNMMSHETIECGHQHRQNIFYDWHNNHARI